jgi:hypothetical protein
MNKLPSAALQPKHASHTHSYRDEFLATADLGSPAFHLNDTREIIGCILGGAGVLLTDILKKSVLFLLCLGALTVVEEIIIGYFHGRTIVQAIGEIGGGTLQQAIATSILMLLILIPYFTFRVVAVRLGEGVLWQLLTERPTASPQRSFRADRDPVGHSRIDGSAVALGFHSALCKIGFLIQCVVRLRDNSRTV